MATRKTINFLPDIFRSDVNKKFLGATFDQLISEPSFTRVNGYAGRQFSLTYGIADPTKNSASFIEEPTASKKNYQLEPALVVKNDRQQVDLYADYKDLVDKIGYYGGKTDNHDRLFKSEYYSYNPRIDLDKFVNYTRYYWLPDGPDPITITSGTEYIFPNQTDVIPKYNFHLCCSHANLKNIGSGNNNFTNSILKMHYHSRFTRSLMRISDFDVYSFYIPSFPSQMRFWIVDEQNNSVTIPSNLSMGVSLKIFPA